MAMMGLSKNQELDSGALLRDARPLGRRIADSLSKPDIAAATLMVTGAVTVVTPQLWEFLTAGGIGFYYWYRSFEKNKWQMPFKMPVWLKSKDPAEPAPGTKKPSPASGICYIGNERASSPGSYGEQIWATNSDMRTHMLVFGTTGSGKAQPLDALVHTPAGWRRMGDLKRGDAVTTPDGGHARIDGVFPQGDIPVYRFVFEDGRSTQACGNHLWEAEFRAEKSSSSKSMQSLPRVLNTSQMIKVMGTVEGRFVVPLAAPVQKPQAQLAIDPYLMGYLLGDEEFSVKNLAIICHDAQVLEKLKAALPVGFLLLPVRTQMGKYWFKWDGSEKAVNPLAVALVALGLGKALNRNKHIPAVYLESSIEQRRALLSGLLDSAGAVLPRRGVNFECLSEAMASGAQSLVRSLGGVAPLWTRFDKVGPAGVTRTTQPIYQVAVRIEAVSSYMTIPRMVALCSDLPKPNGLAIKSIEEVGVKPAQCIHIDHDSHLYITDDYVVTHNTEALTSIATNALSWASGFIYVDGKADSALYAKIYAMARRMGRDDDILVINLMTGSMDVTQIHKVKMSNTMNPFSTGSADFLTQMIVSLMSESGGDNAMWKDRAISLVSGLMGALCYMRDYEGLLLNTGVIREYLNFPKLYTLFVRRAEFPGSIGKAIEGYVRSLPGFQEKNRANQGEDTLKQHGFLEMQFTRIMGSLADTYGHIFMHELAEVDLEDVVLNRRILVVLLPSLEKSPDELRNLGNIVVAALRAMMAKTLGAKIEGQYSEVVEAKPTNAPSPYFAILDEYGYYAVKGAAVMFAQARSLGFSMIVAGQDRQALDKASKEEAGSIIANCKIKISMALEDPTETYDLFSKAAGEAYATQVSGFSANTGGLMVSYNDMGNASLEKRARLTLQELKDLNPGEGIVMVGSKIIRADMFFSNIPKAKRGMRINRFLKVKPPSPEALAQQGEHLAKIIEKLVGDVPMSPSNADDLSVISDYFARTPVTTFNVRERAIGALMGYVEVNRKIAQGLVSSLMEDEDRQIGESRADSLFGDSSAPSLPDESFNASDIADPLIARRRDFMAGVLKVDGKGGDMGSHRKPARAAISDNDEIAAPSVDAFASKPARDGVAHTSAGTLTRFDQHMEDVKRVDEDVLGDMLSDFTSLFGDDAVVGDEAESAQHPAVVVEPKAAPLQPSKEASGEEQLSSGIEALQGLLPAQPEPTVTESSQDAGSSAGLLQDDETDVLGDMPALSLPSNALEALAENAGFADVKAMRESFVDVEKGVGGHDDVSAQVNVDLALKTLEESFEEYPDQPTPPPASAENVVNLLTQLVENYEDRSEPAEDEES